MPANTANVMMSTKVQCGTNVEITITEYIELTMPTMVQCGNNANIDILSYIRFWLASQRTHDRVW